MNQRTEQDRILFDTISARWCAKDLDPAAAWCRRLRLEQTVSAHLRNKPDILEIGCGCGFTAQYLHGRFRSYTGIDHAQALVDFARQYHKMPRVKFHCCDLFSFHPDNRFDLICMIGVLHHVSDPAGALRHLTGLLKKNGRLVINEPQRGNPFINTMRHLRKHLDRSYSSDQVFFNRREIMALFATTPCRATIRYQGLFTTPMAEVRCGPLSLRRPLARLLVRLEPSLERLANKMGLGSICWNMIVSAEKT